MGRAAALLFAREGARVAALDVDSARASATADTARQEGLDVMPLTADVASSEDVRSAVGAVVAAYRGLHVLYNNAGVWLPDDAAAVELDEEVWARTLAVNLTGVFLCCKHGIPAIVRSGGGAVINTSSPVAVRPEPGYDAYTASKGGVIALSRALAQRHGRDGIRVNVLMPGFTETAMTRGALAEPGVREQGIRSAPLGRIGVPEDVAHMAVFLASDESAYVTGSLHWVDGGWSLGPELDEVRPSRNEPVRAQP